MTLPMDYGLRKLQQMWTYLTEYFPDSFEAEVNVAVVGNEQHNKGEPLHWARDKSTDQMNCAFRHMWDHTTDGPKDADGCYHLAKAIWRLKAELQLTIERERQDREDHEAYQLGLARHSLVARDCRLDGVPEYDGNQHFWGSMFDPDDPA